MCTPWVRVPLLHLNRGPGIALDPIYYALLRPVPEGLSYAMGQGTAHLHVMRRDANRMPLGSKHVCCHRSASTRSQRLHMYRVPLQLATRTSKMIRRGRPRAATLFLSSSVVCCVSQLSPSRRPQRRYFSLGSSPSSHLDISADLSISRPAPRGAGRNTQSPRCYVTHTVVSILGKKPCVDRASDVEDLPIEQPRNVAIVRVLSLWRRKVAEF